MLSLQASGLNGLFSEATPGLVENLSSHLER